MDALLKKMTWKEGMNIRVWNSPPEFVSILNSWNEIGLIDSTTKPYFLLAFVQSPEELKEVFSKMEPYLIDDEQLWIAYPKKTSKKYKATINRDAGWSELGKHDLEAVRQIAIDDDWSALRFRKTKFIKIMTRSFSTKNQ